MINTEIIIDDQADDVTEKRFQSSLPRYQIGLETSIKAGDFVLNVVHLCV